MARLRLIAQSLKNPCSNLQRYVSTEKANTPLEFVDDNLCLALRACLFVNQAIGSVCNEDTCTLEEFLALVYLM